MKYHHALAIKFLIPQGEKKMGAMIRINNFDNIKIYARLRGSGMKQKKCNIHPRTTSRWLLLFYSQASKPSVNFNIINENCFLYWTEFPSCNL